MKKLEFDPNNWNWYAYLDADKEVKLKHYKKADVLAASWVTCACGKLCKVLPKNILDNEPDDEILSNLSLWFNNYIEHKDFFSAKRILDKIEARTSYLLTLPDYIEYY